jgi:hypothetical protein
MADLVSPQMSGDQCLRFSYHMYGADIGSLEVYQKTSGSLSQLLTKSGDHGNQWKKAEVQITNGNSYSVSAYNFFLRKH